MVCYVLGVLLGIAALVVLFGQRGDLEAARHQFRHLDIGWVTAAVLAEGTSLAGYGFLHRRVLSLAGARIALPGLVALSLANEAIANTVPGGPALSCFYRYRYFRQRGSRTRPEGEVRRRAQVPVGRRRVAAGRPPGRRAGRICS
jgi:uncharacterized membrane protein YbhN (UPF0104 family)